MANESGNRVSDADIAKMKRLLSSKESGKTVSDADVKRMNEMLGKVQTKADGGVVNTTKAMPVGMMDGGKVKPMKMNMGGVAKGRGGMFKGIR
tara:strand:- start:791 stop:1069 length:279 start_codon:yes stop_codon:yes gene_type:complete